MDPDLIEWLLNWTQIEHGLLEHVPTKLRVAIVANADATLEAFATHDSVENFLSANVCTLLTMPKIAELAETLCRSAGAWYLRQAST
jgi:hypothetical protein